MAIKTLNYTVTADGISPNYERRAGVQYDHNKTQLQFTLDSELYNALLEKLADGNLSYRFDCYDGEGKLHLGENHTLEVITLEPYALSYWVTKFGGKLKVCLVITISNCNTTTTEFSGEVILSLDDLAQSDADENAYKSLSTLTEQTADYAETVNTVKNDIIALHCELTEIKAMLESGEWVFDGNSDTELDIRFVVDDELDLTSKNAVANCAVTEKFNSVDNKMETLVGNISQTVYDSLIGEMKAELLLSAHPIGSYYWSSENTDPQYLFGGVWEQVKDVFILAAGDEYTVDSAGGEAKHKLTVSEMPKHAHGFKSDYGVNGIDFVVPTASTGSGGSSIKKQESVYHPGHWASLTWGTTQSGGNQAHNNMPPYLTAYCFKRIG